MDVWVNWNLYINNQLVKKTNPTFGDKTILESANKHKVVGVIWRPAMRQRDLQDQRHLWLWCATVVVYCCTLLLMQTPPVKTSVHLRWLFDPVLLFILLLNILWLPATRCTQRWNIEQVMELFTIFLSTTLQLLIRITFTTLSVTKTPLLVTLLLWRCR